uniref:(northern house mosquito) hypothetical protein n=1 Tax=Culex pipiens TaxID=7175 RepID=A0A8D8NVC6_CULPI
MPEYVTSRMAWIIRNRQHQVIRSQKTATSRFGLDWAETAPTPQGCNRTSPSSVTRTKSTRWRCSCRTAGQGLRLRSVTRLPKPCHGQLAHHPEANDLAGHV